MPFKIREYAQGCVDSVVGLGAAEVALEPTRVSTTLASWAGVLATRLIYAAKTWHSIAKTRRHAHATAAAPARG